MLKKRYAQTLSMINNIAFIITRLTLNSIINPSNKLLNITKDPDTQLKRLINGIIFSKSGQEKVFDCAQPDIFNT